MTHPTTSTVIRAATFDDYHTIAAVHLAGWQWGYRGQLPDDYLQTLSLADREQLWRDELTVASPHLTKVWLAEQGARALGFVATSLPREPDHDTETAQLLALYLQQSATGTGLGNRLLTHAIDDLRHRTFKNAYLWVLENNQRARHFYERCGWHTDGARKIDQRNDCELVQVRYCLVL